MTIMRQLGTIEDMVDIFVQDATVSTGLGLPNLVISTFSSYYHRSDMTSTSSVTLVSTGTLGTWSSGQFLQINSTFMRGWYQFCLPNGMFAAGSTVAFHMYGHPSMAPVVMRYDITRFNNQRYVSSEPHNVERLYRDVLVTSAAGVVAAHVTSMSLRVGVSSFGLAVGVSSNPIGVNVTSYRDTAAVTTFAGYPATYMDLGLTNNSTSTVNWSSFTTGGGQTAPVGVSSISVAVSTGWFSGAGIVTTQAGRLSVDVSSIMGTKIVTTFAGYPATYFDLGLTNNSTSTVTFSNFQISTQTATVSGSVDVSSFYGSGVVTSAAGVLVVGRVGVSSFGLPVGISSNPIGVRVTTMSVGVDVTSFIASAGVFTAADSSVIFSSVSWSTAPSLDVSTIIDQMSSARISSVRNEVSSVLGPVNVSSVWGSGFVTTADGTLGVGRVGVSSFNSRVGVSSIDQRVGVSTIGVGVSTSWFSGGTVVTSVAGVLASHVTSMRVAVDAQIVDRLLGRNVSSGADGGRTVAEALYVLRNRTQIESGTLTVYQTDDSASSWTATVSTASGNPLVGLDPG